MIIKKFNPKLQVSWNEDSRKQGIGREISGNASDKPDHYGLGNFYKLLYSFNNSEILKWSIRHKPRVWEKF